MTPVLQLPALHAEHNWSETGAPPSDAHVGGSVKMRPTPTSAFCCWLSCVAIWSQFSINFGPQSGFHPASLALVSGNVEFHGFAEKHVATAVFQTAFPFRSHGLCRAPCSNACEPRSD